MAKQRRQPPSHGVNYQVCQSILIRDLELQPLFILDFYGLSGELTVTPGGGNIVAAALEKRDIDPHSVSFNLFDTTPVNERSNPLWRL